MIRPNLFTHFFKNYSRISLKKKINYTQIFGSTLKYSFSQKKEDDSIENKDKIDNQSGKNVQKKINDNIKDFSVKYSDLMSCLYRGEYEKGIQMTNQYISEKEQNFGLNYEGYEQDLNQLSQFTLNSSQENAIKKAHELSLKAFNLAFENDNLKACLTSYYDLFFIWKMIFDFQEMKDISVKIKEITERQDMNMEDRQQLYLTFSIVEMYYGNVQESINILEDFAQKIENVYNDLQYMLEDAIQSLDKDYTDKEQLQKEKQDIEDRIFNCLFSISKNYTEISLKAQHVNEWENFDQLKKYSEKILLKIQKQNSQNLQRIQSINSALSTLYFYSFKRYFQNNKLEKAKQNLELSYQLFENNKQNQNPQLEEFFYLQYINLYLRQQNPDQVQNYLNKFEKKQQLQLQYSILKSQKGSQHLKTIGFYSSPNLQKYKDAEYQIFKASVFIKLNKLEEALKLINIIKEAQEGINNRPLTKLAILQIESAYYSAMKEYSKANSLLKEFLVISQKIYGDSHALIHLIQVQSYQQELLQIQESNQYKVKSKQILQIKEDYQVSLDIIKQKDIFDPIKQSEFENLLQICIKQIDQQ